MYTSASVYTTNTLTSTGATSTYTALQSTSAAPADATAGGASKRVKTPTGMRGERWLTVTRQQRRRQRQLGYAVQLVRGRRSSADGKVRLRRTRCWLHGHRGRFVSDAPDRTDLLSAGALVDDDSLQRGPMYIRRTCEAKVMSLDWAILGAVEVCVGSVLIFLILVYGYRGPTGS